MRLDTLEHHIVAAHAASMNHRIAMLFAIAAFDRQRLYDPSGFESTAKWLTWRLEMAPETAREHVRVARALNALPKIADALRAGSISYARVRAITRIAKPTTQDQWLTLAQQMNAPDLERHIRDLRMQQLQEDPKGQAAERHLRTKTGADGMTWIEGKAPTVDGAIITAALRAAGKDLDVSTETDDDLCGRPMADRRRLDAFVEICRRYLSGRDRPSRREEFRVLVNFDASNGTARIADGPILSRTTLVDMLRTAKVGVTITTPDGQVHAGDITRKLPRKLRREILLRDRHCQYPSCHNNVHIDVHHKIYQHRGGTHHHTNLAALCSYHHRYIHRTNAHLEHDQHGHIQIRLQNGTLINRQPSGTEQWRTQPVSA